MGKERKDDDKEEEEEEEEEEKVRGGARHVLLDAQCCTAPHPITTTRGETYVAKAMELMSVSVVAASRGRAGGEDERACTGDRAKRQNPTQTLTRAVGPVVLLPRLHLLGSQM